jgi:hypothetical protein
MDRPPLLMTLIYREFFMNLDQFALIAVNFLKKAQGFFFIIHDLYAARSPP